MTEASLGGKGEMAAETKPRSGDFLKSINHSYDQMSPMGLAVKFTAQKYFSEGSLAFALDFIKANPSIPLADYWENSALLGFRVNSTSETMARFDDAISSGGPRTLDLYLDRSIYPSKFPEGSPNPLNDDSGFWVDGDCPKGKRPKPFVIHQEQSPVIALVALDPSKLDQITQPDREVLLSEISTLKKLALSDDEGIRDGAGDIMTPRLRRILSDCLIANDTFFSAKTEDGSEMKWSIPFDLFASLKALYTLISGDFHSGNMRQGAVRIGIKDHNKEESMIDIIVAGSGLNSAIDEMVARNFARDVLEVYTEFEILVPNRRPKRPAIKVRFT